MGESHARTIAWSVVVGALGLLASWGGTVYFTRRQQSRDPHLYWILGLAALLGVIVTEAEVRRLHESGRAHRLLIYWLLGIVALLPAWGIALWGLTWTRP